MNETAHVQRRHTRIRTLRRLPSCWGEELGGCGGWTVAAAYCHSRVSEYTTHTRTHTFRFSLKHLCDWESDQRAVIGFNSPPFALVSQLSPCLPPGGPHLGAPNCTSNTPVYWMALRTALTWNDSMLFLYCLQHSKWSLQKPNNQQPRLHFKRKLVHLSEC